MTDPPEGGGQPGDYEERWAHWFLEQSFFRDFIYRNPRGKRKGTELADALVLFDDVALLVQVKAQCGNLMEPLEATRLPGEQARGFPRIHQKLGWWQPVPPAKAREPYDNEVVKRPSGRVPWV